MTDFTPGPWRARVRNGNYDTYGPFDASGRHVMHLSRPRAELDANLALMEAAPDLLAACEEGLQAADALRWRLSAQFPNSPTPDVLANCILQLQAAIAKARGVEVKA